MITANEAKKLVKKNRMSGNTDSDKEYRTLISYLDKGIRKESKKGSSNYVFEIHYPYPKDILDRMEKCLTEFGYTVIIIDNYTIRISWEN